MQPKGNRRNVAYAIVAVPAEGAVVPVEVVGADAAGQPVVVIVADVVNVADVVTDCMKLCSCSELKRILLGFLADFSPGFEAGGVHREAWNHSKSKQKAMIRMVLYQMDIKDAFQNGKCSAL